jgi:hypothetical protein
MYRYTANTLTHTHQPIHQKVIVARSEPTNSNTHETLKRGAKLSQLESQSVRQSDRQTDSKSQSS